MHFAAGHPAATPIVKKCDVAPAGRKYQYAFVRINQGGNLELLNEYGMNGWHVVNVDQYGWALLECELG